MSDQIQTEAERLNVREQIARIDVAILEGAKYRAETPKLEAERLTLNVEREKLSIEREKLAEEREKLVTEQMKLLRDRAVVSWQVIAAVLVAGGGLVGATLGIANAFHLLK